MFEFKENEIILHLEHGNCLSIKDAGGAYKGLAVVKAWNNINDETYWLSTDNTKLIIDASQLPNIIKQVNEFIPTQEVYASNLSVY